MQTLEVSPVMDFQSETYKDAYSRINAIVIEGELEANNNYKYLSEHLSESKRRATQASPHGKSPHERGFKHAARTSMSLQICPLLESSSPSSTTTFKRP